LSQPELVARLRAARPVAPRELRERVVGLAERSAPPRPPRRFRWRRATLVLVPAAAAAVLAAALIPSRDTGERAAVTTPAFDSRSAAPVPSLGSPPATESEAAAPSAGGMTQVAPKTADAPAPSGTRAQRYSAFLALRVADADAVSTATQRALSVVSSLGGHPVSVGVDTSEAGGAARLLVRVPRASVQEAVRRLGALGTIVGANVQIEDLQAGIDETARTIGRLEARRAALRAQEPTPELERRIAALSAQLGRLRTQQAEARRAAELATLDLSIEAPTEPVVEDDGSPFSGLGTAFRWAGIGAVYALAFAAPLAVVVLLAWLAARLIRRRREERLLSAS
jgi:hypothetical protein